VTLEMERVKVRLPVARGPLSNFVVEHLRRPVHKLPGLLAPTDDPLVGDDLHLALYCSYRLHGPGFDDVDGAWEWNTTLIEFRDGLERQFFSALKIADGDAFGDAGAIVHLAGSDDGLYVQVERLAHSGDEEELSSVLARRALTAEALAVVASWMLRRFPGGNLQAQVLAKAARKTVADFEDAGISFDIDAVPGPELARANLLYLLGSKRQYDAALHGAIAVVGAIDHRSDRALAKAAARMGRGEQRSALELSAARAIDSLPLDVIDRPRGAARAAAGAQWMLASSARAAAAPSFARRPVTTATETPLSTTGSSPA
jgi:hypothetical protein